MKKSRPHILSRIHTAKAPGRPPSLTKVEEQRYITLRNWHFTQREAGALARSIPRGGKGSRPRLGASTCQRLDELHGPFAEEPRLPNGHSADSLRKLPERALVALADARGDSNNRRYMEAVGLRPVVKRARQVKKPPTAQDVQLVQVNRRVALPEESVTRVAWNRAQSVHAAFFHFPARTLAGC